MWCGGDLTYSPRHCQRDTIPRSGEDAARWHHSAKGPFLVRPVRRRLSFYTPFDPSSILAPDLAKFRQIQAMEKIRILQLSDIHLLANPDDAILGVRPDSALQVIISDIETSHIDPDLVVLTGDLSDDGLPESYERLCKVFENWTVPIVAIPGNHDKLANMQISFEGSKIRLQSEVAVSGWIIALINSQTPNEAYGSVSPEDLAQLESTLSKADGKQCLIALHHTPIPSCSFDVCQLKHSHEFLGTLSKHTNVKLVIAGHTHCCSEDTSRGIPIHTAPSTFLQFKHSETAADTDDFMKNHTFDRSKGGYQVIDLFPNGGFESKVRWVEI